MEARWNAADYCWMLNHGIAVYEDAEHEQIEP